MKKVKLTDIAPYSGKRVQPFDGVKRYMSTGDLKGDNLNFEDVTYESKPSRADILVSEGDILFAKMTNTNKALQINKELDGIIVSTGFSVHRPIENELYGEYFLHFLKHDSFQRQKNRLCTGAIQSAISNSGIERIFVPVPDYNDQLHIANLLSKAENLIAQRKESIRLLDEFLKSTFLEMFGDPVRNEKGWEKDKVISYTDCIVPGRDKPKSFTGNTPWFTTEDLNHKGYVTKSKKELGLSAEEIKEVRARVIPAGSVLMTCVGDLGVISVCMEDCVVNQQLHAFICKEEMNNLFLMYSLSFQKNFMYKKATSTTVPYMNKTTCNSIPVIKPPIELQNQFARIVEKTEALKAQYRQSLQELENLYGSLSQRAFRGELTIAQPVKQKRANISDKALLAFYQKQIIGHVIKKHQEHRMEQGEMILAKDLYHLEALYGIKTHFQFKNWHYGTYDPKIRKLINGKDKYFTKKSVGQKGFQVLALGEKSDALFKLKYPHKELEFIGKAMDELLDLYASFPIKERSHKIELLNTVCKSIVDAQSTELAKVREIMKQWKTTKAGFKNKAEKFSEQETDEMIELIINKEWDKKLL